jgi:hypothetical protein
VYSNVRIWMFEPGKKSGSDSSSPASPTVDMSIIKSQPRAFTVSPPVCLTAFPKEERHAIYNWITYTGPWIANYGPPSLRPVWEVTIPRYASQLPAMRHIMVAIGTLDEPLPAPDAHQVSLKCRQVLHHYNSAIRHLVESELRSRTEILLTSILSWLLEVMGFHGPNAQVHISAASKIIAEMAPFHDATEDACLQDVQASALITFCQAYLSSTPQTRSHVIPDEFKTLHAENPMLQALLLRRGACPVTSLREIKEAWQDYFTTIQPLLPNGRSPADAEGFIAYWKVASIRYRYIAREPLQMVLIGYLLGSLARALLPGSSVDEEPAVDYLLDRARDMILLQLTSEHKMLMDEMLTLMLETITRFCSLPRQCEAARESLNRCTWKFSPYAASEASTAQAVAVFDSVDIDSVDIDSVDIDSRIGDR